MSAQPTYAAAGNLFVIMNVSIIAGASVLRPEASPWLYVAIVVMHYIGAAHIRRAQLRDMQAHADAMAAQREKDGGDGDAPS